MNLYEINIEIHQKGDIQTHNFTVAANSPIEATRDVLTEIINKGKPEELSEHNFFEIRCGRQWGSVVLKSGPGLNVNTICPPPRLKRRRK